MSNIISKRFICEECKKEIIIDGTKQQWDEYNEGYIIIQKIFPEISVDDRELLLTGQCGKCFDEIFSEKEEI